MNTNAIDVRDVSLAKIRIDIASPCSVDWDSMKGNHRMRLCGQCDKNVYNVTHLTNAEVLDLMKSGNKPCLMLMQRKDGTVMTADCPKGLMRKWALRGLAMVVSALAMIPLFDPMKEKVSQFRNLVMGDRSGQEMSASEKAMTTKQRHQNKKGGSMGAEPFNMTD
jgi:hypothetical protein